MKGRTDLCHLCEAQMGIGEVYLSQGDLSVCLDCADGLTVEDLMHLTGTRTSREMLMAIGFEKVSV